MKSYWPRVGLYSNMIAVLIERRCDDKRGECHAKTQDVPTQRKDGHVTVEAKVGIRLLQTQELWGHQKLEEVRKGLPQGPAHNLILYC